MPFSAKVLRDSMNGDGGRITTVELSYPRCIHAEFMTHRMFARNSASSRAIPVKKMMARVDSDPFIPIRWGANEKGMQAYTVLSDVECSECEREWIAARDRAVESVNELLANNLHKQIANRLLEPWMWITVIATGNKIAFENFFSLRCHEAAEPHIQKIAYMLRDEYDKSEPRSLESCEWHLPLTGFAGDEKLGAEDRKRVSVARCARVSYLTHDGTRNVQADLDLHDRLAKSGHWSPFEHVAAAHPNGIGGNLGPGWMQYRKTFAGEVCDKAPREQIA